MRAIFGILVAAGAWSLCGPAAGAESDDGKDAKKAEAKDGKDAKKAETKDGKDAKKAEAKDGKNAKKAEAKDGKNAKKGRKEKAEKKSKRKGPSWAVIRNGNELQVVKGEQVAEIKKAIDKQNEKAAKAKKDGKKPESPKLEILQEGFGSPKEAEKFAAKYKEDLLAKKKAEKAAKAKKETAEKKDPGAEKKVPPDEVEL